MVSDDHHILAAGVIIGQHFPTMPIGEETIELSQPQRHDADWPAPALSIDFCTSSISLRGHSSPLE